MNPCLRNQLGIDMRDVCRDVTVYTHIRARATLMRTRSRLFRIWRPVLTLPGSKTPLIPRAETEPTLPSLLRALMAAVPQQEPAFVVAGEETLNKFDAQFVDRKWGQSQTTTFFLGAMAGAERNDEADIHERLRRAARKRSILNPNSKQQHMFYLPPPESLWYTKRKI